MKRSVLRRLLAVCLAALLILPGCQQITEFLQENLAQTESPKESKPLKAPTFPEGVRMLGREALENSKNSTALLHAYKRIQDAVEDGENTVDLEDLGLSEKQLKQVYTCYRNDNPQHFWLGNSYTYNQHSDSGEVVDLELEFLLSGTKLKTARQEFTEALEAILSDMPEDADDFTRELYLHDTLLAGCEYAQAGELSHSAYGALVQGQAVCEGYAEAFACLLHRADIPCMQVSGEAGGVNHAWVAVYIQGDWYYTDPTWNDPVVEDPQPEDPIYHAYFNLTFDRMAQDHDAQEEAIALPEAVTMEQNYHVRRETVVSAFNGSQMEAWVRSLDRIELFVDGDVNGFVQDMNRRLNTILKNAGRTDVESYRYYICGQEIVLILK